MFIRYLFSVKQRVLTGTVYRGYRNIIHRRYKTKGREWYVTAERDMTEHSAETVTAERRADGAGPAVKDSRRLFMGNLPKAKTEKEIRDEVSRVTPGLVRVITYKNFEDPALHRGFCFLDYASPAAANHAKQLLAARSHTVFGCKTIVDWADPEPEHDDRLMATVRILFVRQFGGTLDEATLAKVFGRYGTVERVKSLKNYAFVHFARRQDALAAMGALDGAVDMDTNVRIDVSWAKPPADKQTREKMLRDRERRMQQQQSQQQQAAKCGKLAVPTEYVARDTVAGHTTVANDAVAAPYSTYDHYQYDFGRPSFGCAACQMHVDATGAAHQRCPLLHCPCVAAVAAEAVAAARPANGCDHHDHRQHSAGRQCNRGGDLQTVRGGESEAARHDHGDCAAEIADNNNNNNNFNLDANILKFFFKVTTTANSASGDKS